MTDKLQRSRRPDRELKKAVEASRAPAISRAAAVLRLLGKKDKPQSLQSIARELGLVPSTCFYVLRALVAEEFVSFDPDTKRYSLEAGVLTLARHWLRRNRFNDLAQPALERLSEAFGVTAFGVHIVGLDHIIVVAVSHSGNDLQLSAEIGSRFPALISATGRCIAAFGDHPESEIQARFKTLHWAAPPTWDDWKAQVEQTRVQGFAVDEGNYMAGVTVLAAPVWKTFTRPSHALVTVGMGSALRSAGLPALERAVCSAAQDLSTQLRGEAS